MKKIRLTALTLALCTAFSACSRFVPSSYTRVSAHSQTKSEQMDTNVVNVDDYAGLRRAIRDFVRGGVEHGVIRVQQYTGTLEDDLAAAAYSVAREDPAGAYAVDYMTHECTLIVSYYEIHVDITFRKTLTPLSQIPYVSVLSDLERRLHEAMDGYDAVLTIYAGYDQEPDYAALAQDYYEQNLGRLMALPQITVESYPQGGKPRIVELTMHYPESSRTLESMAQQVSDTVSAASVYVRFRESAWEKLQLLYSYLTERFTYTEEQTQTPVYSLLCEGYATSWSMAQCWALLCQEAGLECQVVKGLRGSADYWWNEVCLDGTWYHMDLMQDVMEQSGSASALRRGHDRLLLGRGSVSCLPGAGGGTDRGRREPAAGAGYACRAVGTGCAAGAVQRDACRTRGGNAGDIHGAGFAKFSIIGTEGLDFSGISAIIIPAFDECGCSSSGRAPPCQGGGSEFEPRHPLHKTTTGESQSFLFRKFCDNSLAEFRARRREIK